MCSYYSIGYNSLYIDRFALAGDGSNAGLSHGDRECINPILRYVSQADPLDLVNAAQERLWPF
jgi:hypothetical protein